MARVFLAQCLCGPGRHAILAAASDDPDAESELIDTLRGQVAELVAARLLNRWCALCKSPESAWTYEVGRTRWTTLAEAEPELRKSEADQIMTNALLGDIPRND